MSSRCRVQTSHDQRLHLPHALTMMLRDGHLDHAAKLADPTLARILCPASHYLAGSLRHVLSDWIPEQNRYDELFRRFEYLFSLAISHYYEDSGLGRLAVAGLYMDRFDLQTQIDQEIERCGTNWPLLTVFDGSIDRVKRIKVGHDLAARNLASELGYI